MENQALASAFAAAGLSALSTAVATAGESPEAVVKAIGREFESVQAQTDPRVKALDEAGISSSEDLKKLQADAAFGLEKENELRAYGKKMAIAALGQEKGAARAESIASMPREVLGDVVASYEEIEAAKTGRGSDGHANRQTASSRLDVVTFAKDMQGTDETFEDGIAAKVRRQNGVKA